MLQKLSIPKFFSKWRGWKVPLSKLTGSIEPLEPVPSEALTDTVKYDISDNLSQNWQV